ncbi:phage portal protein [Blastococcus sp. SYSU D00813]
METSEALRLVVKLHKRLSDRQREIDRFEAYFRGDHPLSYASNAWAAEHAARYKGFSDNWCGVVGKAAAERTRVAGIRLGEDTRAPLDDDERALWRDWSANELTLKSAQGFLTASVARRSAVLVWGNRDDEPVVTWEHPAQVIVDYEPGTGRPRYALKAWADEDQHFATLYTADQVWKFQRRAAYAGMAGGVTTSGLWVPNGFTAGNTGGWERRQPAEDNTWPLANPLGELPVRELEHKPQLRGEPLSRIDGTIAMQDAINLLWAYLFVAADFASMPARVVMGQEPPKLPILNEQGQKIGEKAVDIGELARGRMLWLTGQNAKIGSWDAAKLDVFTDVVKVAVQHVMSQTSTPAYYVNGELGNTNGETLKATETPLVMDVRDDHEFYAAPIRGMFRLMAMVRGNTRVADACRTATIGWKNPEIQNEAQLADAALKDRQVGFPLEWIAQDRYGMSQIDVDRVLDMVARDPAGSGVLNGVLAPFAAGDDGTDTA